jgi:hypothetical protein
LYDFAFDKRNLSREFIRADFKTDVQLLDEAYRLNLVKNALAQAANGLTNFSLSKAKLRGKPVYQLAHLEHALILRKFSRNIKRLTKVKQSDRNTITKCLKALLSEGHCFRVYKLDLRSFYESIERSDIERLFMQDRGLSPPMLHVFQSFSSQLSAANVEGLPRGLAVSAVLSEYVMRGFDQSVKSVENVYYYARYVDDIVVITTGSENEGLFLKELRKNLPAGIQLNNDKTKAIEFNQPSTTAANNAVENCVDFLGYRFTVHRIMKGKPLTRQVYADISQNKTTRLKTRIVLSALQFIRDKNFVDLYDRIRVLTGNYNVYDLERKVRRNVGIYYNYRFVDVGHSTALKELDAFLKHLLLATTGKIAGQLNTLLSAKQKRKLLTLSFDRSFRHKENFYHFQINRLTHLVGCWAYE